MAEADNESENFFHLVKLIVDVGSEVLRDVLLHIIKPDTLENVLQINMPKIDSLQTGRPKILFDNEYNLLTEKPPNSDKFDITLLLKIFRYVCPLICPNVISPNYVWGPSPGPKNIRLEDDIQRMREIRNSIFAHIKSTKVTDDEFQVYWAKITATITRAANHGSPGMKQRVVDKIDTIRTEKLKSYSLEVFRAWYEEDKKKFENMKKQLKQQRDAVSETKAMLLEQGTNLIQLVTKVQGIDEKVGEIAANLPSISEKQSITDTEKSQLRQYLIDGYEQKFTLLLQWKQLPVSEIFTPSIRVCDEENKTHKKEEFRNLESYRQLFYKNDVLQKRVILLGEAGTGKTTFSKHLTDVWCGTTTLTQYADAIVLKQFWYLFYVSCRFAEEKETLLDMINNQLFNDGRMKEVALYMLKYYPKYCLIVLDGADEWKGSPTSETGRRGDITGLPGMTGVEDCLILITSRPWRFHALPTKAKDIFRRLEINGVKDVEVESKIPAEILQMDERAIELYKNALEEGKEHNYSIRLMVTGPYGVGKSTLTKRLLCQDVDINDRTSTDGIDVHVKKCKVSLETSRWKMNDTVDDNTTQRLAKVLQNARAKDTADESLNTENASEDYDGVHLQDTDKETDGNELYTPIYVRDDNAPKSAETSTSSKTAAEAYGNITSDTGNIVDVDDVPKSSDYNRLKHKELLLKDLKDVISSPTIEDEDYADVSVWDFGGQFVFYTTHQMFLSRRAVYILVIDMSQGIHAVEEVDEPYFDCDGSKSLKIEDFLDIWLNSIHGHSDGEKSGTPKVILVGTHADKLIPDTRYKQTEAIFDAIRDRFSDKDVRFHFIEKDFGLSNAEIDPKLDDLRKTIFDVARKQSYWGEMRPAKWIPLERLLEDLRRKGVEVMSRAEVADLNRNLPVPIADDQLELFLCFQHETANIMYFSVPELLNYIVLSPKFLVNALKSLITAYVFIKKQVAILDKWKEFRQKGILRISLIDAVWNREENQIFRENREHILSLMEHLNIIARPVQYSDDDEPEKHNRDYYLVPCMLKESPPDSVFHAEGPSISKTCLRLVLENVAFPSAIFNRLLVGCMSHWPLTRSEKKKFHIYCGSGQFDVDFQHRLTLVFHSKVVSLRIERYSKINTYPGVDICRRVYKIVKEILERIGKCLSLVLRYEMLIQCPQCTDSMISMKCWHSIEKLKSCDEFPCHEHDTVAYRQPCDLLKYWFELKDRDHENNSDDTVLPSVLDPAIASRVPTDKELGKISKGIGLEFQPLFLELGISDARIGQIRGSYPFTVADQVIQLLLEWRKQRGCRATFKELETAMNLVGTDTKLAFKDIHV